MTTASLVRRLTSQIGHQATQELMSILDRLDSRVADLEQGLGAAEGDIDTLETAVTEIYSGLISQSATDAPVLTESRNDIGAVVSAYDAVGVYTLTNARIQPGTTSVDISESADENVQYLVEIGSGVLTITTLDTGVAANELLIANTITITVVI